MNYIYANWLHAMPGVSPVKKLQLLESASYSPQEVYDYTTPRLKCFLTDKELDAWLAYKKKSPGQVWLEQGIEQNNIRFTYYGASDYPSKLLNIHNPPLGLYYKGELPEENIPAVAIIGSRKNSEYGRCMAEYFARELAKAGINIISGMAMGIDGIGQRSALRAGGKSYGILGCGVNVIYPHSNKALYYDLISRGGVISEYPPDAAPLAPLFPQRNRIISGLSDVVLVIEAREKSGTLITVDLALDQGREVFAVPGRCTDALSSGCNKLLCQGAGIATTAENILEAMGWSKSQSETKAHDKGFEHTLSETATSIVTVLDLNPSTQEEILEKLRAKGITDPLPRILQGLLELEMRGIATRIAGQYMLSGNAIVL